MREALQPLIMRVSNVAFMWRTVLLASLFTFSFIAGNFDIMPLAYIFLISAAIFFVVWLNWCTRNLIEGVN